jgi:hypothetical protein
LTLNDQLHFGFLNQNKQDLYESHSTAINTIYRISICLKSKIYFAWMYFKKGMFMCSKINIWLKSIENEMQLEKNQIIQKLNISHSTYYRIISGKKISEKTKYKIFKLYISAITKEY